MGLDVYIHDQLHGDSYVEGESYVKDAGESLERVLESVDRQFLLSGVFPYGDTMFNMLQLERIMWELDSVAGGRPELHDDVLLLKSIAEKAIRLRGYLWISGD